MPLSSLSIANPLRHIIGYALCQVHYVYVPLLAGAQWGVRKPSWNATSSSLACCWTKNHQFPVFRVAGLLKDTTVHTWGRMKTVSGVSRRIVIVLKHHTKSSWSCMYRLYPTCFSLLYFHHNPSVQQQICVNNGYVAKMISVDELNSMLK